MRYHDLSKIHREQIYRSWKDGLSANNTIQFIFGGPNEYCALKTIKNKFNWFKTATSEMITKFLNPPENRKGLGGKKRSFGETIDRQIIDAVEECPKLKLHQLEIMLRHRILNEINAIPSKSTICRHLKENKKVRRRLLLYTIKYVMYIIISYNKINPPR
jgi:hypothetical protein